MPYSILHAMLLTSKANAEYTQPAADLGTDRTPSVIDPAAPDWAKADPHAANDSKGAVGYSRSRGAVQMLLACERKRVSRQGACQRGGRCPSFSRFRYVTRC